MKSIYRNKVTQQKMKQWNKLRRNKSRSCLIDDEVQWDNSSAGKSGSSGGEGFSRTLADARSVEANNARGAANPRAAAYAAGYSRWWPRVEEGEGVRPHRSGRYSFSGSRKFQSVTWLIRPTDGTDSWPPDSVRQTPERPSD